MVFWEKLVTRVDFVKGGKARARALRQSGAGRAGSREVGVFEGRKGSVRETSQHNSQHETSQSE